MINAGQPVKNCIILPKTNVRITGKGFPIMRNDYFRPLSACIMLRDHIRQ